MGNSSSTQPSPLKELLKEKGVGDVYPKLKNDETDIYDLAAQKRKKDIVEGLKEYGISTFKAKSIANDLIDGYEKHNKKSSSKKKSNPYINQDNQNEWTTTNASNDDQNSSNNYYEQKQEKQSIQQEVVVRGQVLIDATNDQIIVINKYLKAKSQNKDKKTLRHLNNSTIVGLKLYRGNCKVLYKKQKQNNKMDFSTAFSACEVLVNEFEDKVKQQVYRSPNEQEIISRLVPILDYMRCVINGKKPPKLPEIDQQIVHNKEVAADALGQVLKGMNHTIPDRIDQVNKDHETYERQQKEMAKRGKVYKNKQVKAPNVNDLYQDISGPVYPPKTKKEMNQILENDKKHYAHNNQQDKIYKEIHGMDEDSPGLE